LELLTTGSLGPLSDEQKNALQISQRATGRLESLIDSLILFSLAARGEMTLRLKPVDLNKVASEIINYSQPKARDRNVELNFTIQPDIPFVQADEEKISWVILQLIDNAIKFTPSGGQVNLSITKESDTFLMVTVTDTVLEFLQPGWMKFLKRSINWMLRPHGVIVEPAWAWRW